MTTHETSNWLRAVPAALRVALFLVLSFLLPTAFGARHALVIGNDAYSHVTPLKNARADAKAIARSLERAGFRVILALDQNRSGMNAAMRRFKNGIAGGDEALFFFSGHGVQLGGTNYLLPTDIKDDDEDQIKDDALQLQRVLDDLAEQKAKFSLAIIDACRDNPFKGKGRNLGNRGLAPTSAATGQMIIFSAGVGQQALDRLGDADPVPNGVFTRVLVREIERGGQPVDRVLKVVRSEVVRLARSVGHEQVPAIYDQSIGDFFFHGKAGESEAVRSTGSPENSPANLTAKTPTGELHTPSNSEKAVPAAAAPNHAVALSKRADTAKSSAGSGRTLVEIRTSLGNMIVELYPDKAPRTVENFLQYVKDDFYRGTVFHRVIRGFMIQGGGFAGQMDEKPTRRAIANEARNGLKNERGTIAMARRGDPDSATAQFFINHVDNAGLDYPRPDGHGYTVFGKITQGLDVVDKIAAVETGTHPSGHRNVPKEPVSIESVTLIQPK